jgi:hypothetical protein
MGFSNGNKNPMILSAPLCLKEEKRRARLNKPSRLDSVGYNQEPTTKD